ncbi:MAG TPA: hypothetical protein VJ417_00190, partial [Candidatus Glassbacteria bacterium]|nr:hypothetical protein [Candidatus Glassbacteria bacterium]
AAPPPVAPSPGGPPAAASTTLPTLNQSVSHILQPASQTEILNVFLQSAAAFCGRCAIFVLRGNSFAFWRAKNFSEEAASRARAITVAASQPGIFKELFDNQLAVSSSRSPESLPSGLYEALGDAAETAIYAFPILVQGRLVAALYADAGSVAGSVEPSALEVLAHVAGLSLETMVGRQAAREAPGATATHSPTAAAEGVVPAERAEQIQQKAAAVEPVSFEPASEVQAPAVEPPPDPASLPEEDQDAHRKAHRFARVAVQDLLSYHKDKIEEGRNNKNLYEILREDIEKTRENYQKRFGQTAACSYDYFHFELVVKLANNDLSALGARYPGPVMKE